MTNWGLLIEFYQIFLLFLFTKYEYFIVRNRRDCFDGRKKSILYKRGILLKQNEYMTGMSVTDRKQRFLVVLLNQHSVIYRY